ncbi:hypothetical protein, partial [Piscirickettsia litoralis]|uniref:hypothetical protein n=1 Tax=Piscirickettsia litoralis TaxID=1891921 RepID=UPI001300FFB6
MSKILRLMQSNGYPISEEGMCYGIAFTAILSALKGRFSDYSEFLTRVKSYKSDRKLSLSRENDRDTLAFFDSILILHNSTASGLQKSGSGDEVNQNFGPFFADRQDAPYVLQKFDEGLYSEGKYLKYFKSGDFQQLRNFLNSMREGSENIGIGITIPGHQMAVVSCDNKWVFINHDDLVESDTLDDDFLEKIASECTRFGFCMSIKKFSVDPLSNEEELYDSPKELLDFVELNTLMRLAFLNGHNQTTKDYLKIVNESPLSQDRKAEIFLSSFMENLSPTIQVKVPVVTAAMQNGHHHSYQAYLEAIIRSPLSDNIKVDLFLAQVHREEYFHAGRLETRDTPSIAHNYAVGKHLEIVEAYLRSVNDSGLSDSHKVALFKAEDSLSGPVIAAAFWHGHHQMVGAYLKAVNESGLSPDKKVALFKAEGAGIPAFEFALENQHHQVVGAYLKAVNKSGLNPDEKVQLFLVRNIYNQISITTAFRWGHHQVVGAYLKAVNESGLSPDKKVALFKAENFLGDPAIAAAFWHGHHQVVDAYLKEVNESGLSPDEKVALFKAEGFPGDPAVAAAFKHGHHQVVDAYLKAVNKSGLSDSDKVALFKVEYFLGDLTKAEGSLRNPAIATAFRRGHYQVVDAYLKAVNESGLSDSDKAALLKAEDALGIPAFEFALEDQHNKVVEAYLKAVNELARNTDDLLAKGSDTPNELKQATQNKEVSLVTQDFRPFESSTNVSDNGDMLELELAESTNKSSQSLKLA